jgi:hypothetical protein
MGIPLVVLIFGAGVSKAEWTQHGIDTVGLSVHNPTYEGLETGFDNPIYDL